MNSPKNLRPTTIITPELYVERSADRQLRSIIDDMGRPGYVLVSRQMGKTNLLINMKRERVNDIVLYLDLSNRFDTVRAWFRHVIDSLLEANTDHFGSTETTVHKQRKESDFEANVEFDRHLRLLLRSTDRKIIIILDEIDSLVNAPYSDVILAQIRSMYFSRVSYPEYNRLTYVLSGVAEPSDLIKDKNISPFNIGEKIYLDDFTNDEFKQFITKADLGVTREVTDRIFYWASGNPRMTWDICAELENRIRSGETALPSVIDDIVNKLYLRDFDRPPIDHIRTLVESDSQIRDSIMSIRYGKGDFIDDKTKSRLYLSGITRLSQEGSVEIKNQIIDEALSDRWLQQLSSNRSSLLAKASELFKDEKYDEALKLFQTFFADTQASVGVSASKRIEFGLCYLYVGESTNAIRELLNSLSDVQDRKSIQGINYYLGQAYSSIPDYERAEQSFTIAANGPASDIQRAALLALMPILLRLKKFYVEETFNSGLMLIEELKSADLSADPRMVDALVSALTNMSVASATQGNTSQAFEWLDEAFQVAPAEYHAAIRLRRYDLTNKNQKDERRELLLEIANFIVNSDLPISSSLFDTLKLSRNVVIQCLIRLKREGLFENLKELVAYVSRSIYSDQGLSSVEILLDLFENTNAEERRSENVDLLEAAVALYDFEDESLATKLRLLRSLFTYSEGRRFDVAAEKYLQLLGTPLAADLVDENDLGALTHLSVASIHRSFNAKRARQIFSLAGLFEGKALLDCELWFAALRSHEMDFLIRCGQKEQSRAVAATVLQHIDKILAKDHSPDIGNYLAGIRTKATALLPSPNRSQQKEKIGRNDWVLVRYGDAEPVKKKFKHVEADLKAGLCALDAVDIPPTSPRFQ